MTHPTPDRSRESNLIRGWVLVRIRQHRGRWLAAWNETGVRWLRLRELD